MVFSSTVSAKTNITEIDVNKGLSRGTIDQLEKNIYLLNNGSIFFDKDKASESGHIEKDLIKMEKIIDGMNKKIESGELYVGNNDDTEKNEQLRENEPLGSGVTPIKEPHTLVCCLSKAGAKKLRDYLQDEGLSTFKKFCSEAIIGGVGLHPFFSVFAYVTNTMFSLVTMRGVTDDLEEALNDAAWEMNDDDYIVLTCRVEDVWNTLSGWINEEPPDEMKYLYLKDYEITDEEVEGDDLQDYL